MLLGDIYGRFGVVDVALLGLEWLRWRVRAAVDRVIAATIYIGYPFKW